MITPRPLFGDLTRLHLAREILRWGWSIGAHTYGCPQVLEADLAGLTIGRFCSIGPNVVIALGNHRTDLVTTYPFQAIARIVGGGLWQQAHEAGPDHDTRGDVIIGDEVWLGANCTVLSGVTIGTGAVIGAGAVVRRDVPPYAIVTGNPAQVVRHRFDETIIARLLRLNWCAWPDDKIAAYLPLILSTDITAFLDKAEADAETDSPIQPAAAPEMFTEPEPEISAETEIETSAEPEIGSVNAPPPSSAPPEPPPPAAPARSRRGRAPRP